MKTKSLALSTPEEAEAVFYEAFRQCDSEVMAALWAKGEVVCVHPGSGAIVGHESVLRSWSHIFSGSSMPEINVSVVKRVVSEDLAIHLVSESVSTDEDSAVVICTNIYQKFDDGWFMIEHHASLVPTHRQNQTLQ